METLQRIFGVIVPTFFTTGKGVSLSEINRIQAENKQQNDKFWGLITDATHSVYTKVLTFLGGGTAVQRITGVKMSVNQIRDYKEVAERNAQTSSLMQALKLHKRLEAELQSRDLRDHVVEVLPVPPARPTGAKRATVCETYKFMELSNIDEMIDNLNSDVLEKFKLDFWQRANQLNSRAATLGKLLSDREAFFRELIKSRPLGTDQLTQSGMAVTTWERNYSDEEENVFAELREELQKEYNDLQKQLNGCRKQIKDAVREYNLDQERQHQSTMSAFRTEAEKHSLEMERIHLAAEMLRQQAAKELAALKVRD